MPNADVIVPKIPTTFPFTDPGFTKEYAIGISQSTRSESTIKGVFAIAGLGSS